MNRQQATSHKVNDEGSSQSPVEQQGDVPVQQDRKAGYSSGHEDLAWFTRVAAYLAELEAEARARADERGPHGRRLARLRTVIEDALLQARQGVHEARHGQHE